MSSLFVSVQVSDAYVDVLSIIMYFSLYKNYIYSLNIEKQNGVPHLEIMEQFWDASPRT